MASAEELPLRNLLDAAPDGFIVVDAGGGIVWANQTAHTLFGYGESDLTGHRIEDLIPERMRTQHLVHRSGYQESPHGRPMGLGLNLLAMKKDGTEFPVEISLSPLHTNDGLLVTAIVRDVTERKRLEGEHNLLSIELETERERDRIAMDLHDGVMQDIYAVALGLELALDGEAEAAQADGRMVERSIDQLHDVIRSIRSFIFDLRPRQYPGSLPEAMANLTEEFSQNSQIATKADIESGLELESNVATAVYHIAHESLSNVRKHAAAKHVVVSLRRDDGQGVLEIVDDGRGFDMAVPPPEGHHGMRNMANRARTISATLEIRSRPGEGTMLALRFPLG